MYKVLRFFFFFFNPEWVHYVSMNWLRRLCSVGFIRAIVRRMYVPKSDLHIRHQFGLKFRNNIGLGAGFDKNALYLRELEALGFGFVEIGTVTPRTQDGNPKPRLFRLPEDKALINRMGFNNDGVDPVAARLKEFKQTKAAKNLIIGGNIGKNKDTPNEYAYMDYDKCFRALHDHVDYFVVNVSSPNTPGLRELQEKESLRKILTHLQEINRQQLLPKPLLLKVAPDLTDTQLKDVVDLCLEIKLNGLVLANTTLDRTNLSDAGKIRAAEAGAGGLSGAPIRLKSTEMIRLANHLADNQLPIIGVGGIFTSADAHEKIGAGASLLQVWTGFIYQGPGIVKQILS